VVKKSTYIKCVCCSLGVLGSKLRQRAWCSLDGFATSLRSWVALPSLLPPWLERAEGPSRQGLRSFKSVALLT
jgi:hypothetical protein